MAWQDHQADIFATWGFIRSALECCAYRNPEDDLDTNRARRRSFVEQHPQHVRVSGEEQVRAPLLLFPLAQRGVEERVRGAASITITIRPLHRRDAFMH